MGASDSKELAEEFKVVEDFNHFINYISTTKKVDLITPLTPSLEKLQAESKIFFETYERLNDVRKIGGEGIDFNSYFTKISTSLESFKECVIFLKKNVKLEQVPIVSNTFINDFTQFIKQITHMAITTTKILERLTKEVKPSLMMQFYLELSIFDYSLNIKKSDKPPYYNMSTFSAYEFRDQIHSVKKRYINITAKHGSGKTAIIPLHIYCRCLSNKRSPRFIIVVEHQPSMIHTAISAYREILTAASSLQADEKSEEDEIDNLTVTHSISSLLKLVDDTPLFPCIAVISPREALQLLHSVKNVENFVLKSVFVIDDVHLRTVETDVFFQDISRIISKSKCSTSELRMALLSIVSDSQILNFLKCETLKIESEKDEATKKEILCNSISDIESRCLFREMRHLFESWLVDSSLDVGSVVVFVPSEKLGLRVLKGIFKYYNKDNSMHICPLHTTIRRGEKIEDFYNRLLADLTIAEGERKEVKNTLYLMPLNLSENVTKEERLLIHSPLPLPFKGKLSRVFITTIKNESILQVNDLTIIFDTGIEEVEFFDPKQSSFHIKKQLLPQPFISQHRKLLTSCENGLYYEFICKGKTRPSSLTPSVKRSDLGRTLLSLRSLGIRLEKQKNLPSEPNHQILDECFSLLEKIGIIDDDDSKDLTEIGTEAAKFSVVSPFLALATAKFKENKKFAFLCSLLIENARNLVVQPKSPLLMKNFCSESDIVTLLESICELSEKEDDAGDEDQTIENSGLSAGAVYALYSMIESVFDSADGRKDVVEAVKWARSKEGGTLAMVDKFVFLIDKKNFLEIRRASFRYVVGAGPGNEPTLVYKANKVFNLKADERVAKIRFARRPGWNGLQSPGNIIALSVIVDEERGFNQGLLIHHDKSNDLPGVVSMQVDNPSLNSFFFVSLFSAYWSGHSTVEEFIPIYHTLVPKKESAFLIHMTENNGKTFINYCPKNREIKEEMAKSIPILSSLMPFVPRSIIAKVDTPICAVEIIGYGASNHYTTAIHLIAENRPETPIPYPVNKKTLEFCAKNIDELSKTLPKIRFAITGESFYYKAVQGREVEADLACPDVSPDIKCVFDPQHASHLVILIDSSFKNKPKTEQLEWIPKTEQRRIKRENRRSVRRHHHHYSDSDEDSSDLYYSSSSSSSSSSLYSSENDSDDSDSDSDDDLLDSKKVVTDKEDNDLMLNVTSKIINGIGYAERSSDYFYVTIGGGFPTPGKGELPEKIKTAVGFSEKDGNSIKRGVYPLIRHFVKEFTKNQKLSKPIPLQELSSTKGRWKKSPKNEEEKNTLISQIIKTLAKRFHLKEDEVMAVFLGPSMIAIRIVNLKSELVEHKMNKDVWNDDYQPCRADSEIKSVLEGIRGANMSVSSVIHEPTIKITIWRLARFCLDPIKFEEKVQKIVKMFGFLVSAISEYSDGACDMEQECIGVQGDIEVELLGMATGIAFATSISSEFPLKQIKEHDESISLSFTMATCYGMSTINPRLGPVPEIVMGQRVVKVDPSEIETLKQLIAMKNAGHKRKRWKIDTNYNILIVPETEDAAIKEMMRKVRDKDNDTTCLFLCEPPQVLLSNSLYAYQKDGSVRTIAVCKQCMIEFFRGYDDFMFVIDPITKLVDRTKLINLENNLIGFPFLDDTKDDDAVIWPQIPLGQGVWVLMHDSEDIAPFVKSYFTVIIDFVIRKAINFFTYCPNHPDIPLRTPPSGSMLKCPHCDMIYCKKCRTWHRSGFKCIHVDIEELKRCPNCGTPTFKTGGCNHIACPCGKHWCYKCDKSPIFDFEDDCYDHMTAAHGGYFT